MAAHAYASRASISATPSTHPVAQRTSPAWAKAVVGGIALLVLSGVLVFAMRSSAQGTDNPSTYLIAPAIVAFLGLLLVQVGIVAFAVHLGTDGTRHRLDVLITAQRDMTQSPAPSLAKPVSASASGASLPQLEVVAEPQPPPTPEARRFNEALLYEASTKPGGWVYDIDPAHGTGEPGGPVLPESIKGAWKIGHDGRPTGEYNVNPNYRKDER